MTKPILEAKNITVTYATDAGPVTAVRNVSLTLFPGEIVGLIGESGSGKSSLALALLGLARFPGKLEGEVHFDDKELVGLEEDSARLLRGKDISLITQKPRQSLNPYLNVGTQISRVYRSHTEATQDEALKHAVVLLEDVGINDAERRIDAYPHELSGGMAQRALISMALSSEPKLLIADEPTSGLDVTIQAQFLDRMWRAARDRDMTVLLVTQDVGIIANYCDRTIIMEDGVITAVRDTKEFFANPDNAYGERILKLGRAERTALTAPSESIDDIIKVTDLRKTFKVDGGKVLQAVDNVSFSIRKGRSLGLVGESGSGKTTVGRMILRLLEPDSGVIELDGENISELSLKEFNRLRSKIQVVFQDPFDSLNPRWPIFKSIEEPLKLHSKMTKDERKARVLEVMASAGLDLESADRKPIGLSAGEQQRVCLARALVTRPEFVVLDEPTSALPPAARAELILLLKDLQTQLGLSFVFISHDLSTVRELCHDVAVMYLSQIVEVGTTEEIFAEPKHPYTKALLDSVLFHDPNNRRVDKVRLTDLEGEIPSPVDLPNGCYLAGRCPFVEKRCTDEVQILTITDGKQSVRCWKASENVPFSAS
ncbi:MAG: dipeptide ABC transporter ATP-binding protein [Candidatus Nanopelagicales bacterium]